MSEANQPLALAAALTRRTEQLCIGLEQGIADLYELVTPVTAELLRWWFGEDACESRTFNFHPGQRQAILNVIVAHEVLASPDLKDLYQQVCAAALLYGSQLADVAQDKHRLAAERCANERAALFFTSACGPHGSIARRLSAG